MGTWNTNIIGNDSSLDIYKGFFDLYYQGEKTTDISSKIQQEFADEFEDYECKNNCLFGLALAQWETKSLSLEIFNQVKQIIESGKDLEVWEALGADKKTLKQRRLVLDKFLTQITKEREKPKRKLRPKSTFEKITIVDIIAPDLQKTFSVSEEYNNKQYIHTSGKIKWDDKTGLVLHYNGQGKKISAEWIGNQILKISYDSSIKIIKWDYPVCRGNEEINVIYTEV